MGVSVCMYVPVESSADRTAFVAKFSGDDFCRTTEIGCVLLLRS